MLGGTEKQKLRQNFAKIWQKLEPGFVKARQASQKLRQTW